VERRCPSRGVVGGGGVVDLCVGFLLKQTETKDGRNYGYQSIEDQKLGHELLTTFVKARCNRIPFTRKPFAVGNLPYVRCSNV
jgi:hypothetical protein